jgi:hypothetical protein
MGVMGAGIAYEFKLRYPEMYKSTKKYAKIIFSILGCFGFIKIQTKTYYASQQRNIGNTHLK